MAYIVHFLIIFTAMKNCCLLHGRVFVMLSVFSCLYIVLPLLGGNKERNQSNNEMYFTNKYIKQVHALYIE